MHPNPNSKNRSPSSSLALIGLAGALLCALAAPASADGPKGSSTEDVKTYEESVSRGDVAWEAGRFGEARTAYQQAWEIHQEPTLLFNIASTYRREGKLEQALEYYERYLKIAGADDGFRPQAEETVKKLKSELAKRQSDDEVEEVKPLQKPAPSQPTGPAPSDQPGMHPLQWAGIGTGAVGVAALTYGIFQGSRAMKKEGVLEDVGPGEQWTAQLQKDYDDGKKAERRAIMFSIVGAGAILGGGAMYFVGYRKNKAERESGLSLVPVMDGDAVGAVVLGSF